MSLERLKKIKAVLETKQQEKAKVEGQLEAAFDQLKTFGYKTVAEANKALAAMDKQLEALDAEIGKVVEEMETKYADLL
jgi:hypothetical protein